MNELLLLKKAKGDHARYNELVNTINAYLENNKGATADFTILKDMVDRHVSVLQDQVTNQIQVPLYLGLVGTMVGIIIGLYDIPSDFNTDELTNSIGGLISGVKIAMGAALIGLILTIVSSAYFYKRAEQKAEIAKNKFYSFLQSKLLPVLTQNANTGFAQLHRNLQGFNESFSQNMVKFDGFLNTMTTNASSQVELMNMIASTDMPAMSSKVISVLSKLDSSVGEIEKFDAYLTNINSFLGTARQLHFSLQQQLERTEDIKNIAHHIKENTAGNASVIELVKAELTEIENRKLIMASSVQSVDKTLSDSIDQLKLFSEKKIKAIEEIELKGVQRIDKLISEDRHGSLSELSHLSNLSDTSQTNAKVLSDLVVEIKGIKTNLKGLELSNNNSSIVNNQKPDVQFKRLVKVFLILGLVVALLAVSMMGWYLWMKFG
jgi:hypothetical protein